MLADRQYTYQWLSDFLFLVEQIVMEYCGAGSVADIMRIIERPVRIEQCMLCHYWLLATPTFLA